MLNLVGIFLALQVALPLFLIYFVARPGDMAGPGPVWWWWSWVAFTAASLSFLLVCLPWAQFVPYVAVFLYPAAMVAAAYSAGGWPSAGVSAAVLGGAWYGMRRYCSPRPAAPERIDILPPLAPGVYFVGQGGGSGMVNHHYPSESQRYALDITRLNGIGMRAWGLFPGDLRRFAIYGAAVCSPCDGTVTGVVDGLPDMEPWAQRDIMNIAGNHIVILCRPGPVRDANVYVGLAHLQPASVAVRPGDAVRAGQLLARVGNSGNSTEPHLHIHAKIGGEPDCMLDGRGVPLTIRGRLLTRNDIFRCRPTAQFPRAASRV
ncbi:MAG: M23 family metallopeptidase [Terriglobales bacterium]